LVWASALSAARRAVTSSRAALEAKLAHGDAHYGVNTGFGSLAQTRVPGGRLTELQQNLVRSHASGVGDPLPEDVVRAMTLLLIASLARGRSGVRLGLVEGLVGMLNARITPVVPEMGSVGASGDLAPLSHVALALLGEGEVFVNGELKPAGQALVDAGLTPMTLGAKEGLALINGTHLMAARLALFWVDFERVWGATLPAAAMSMDACLTSHSFLDPRVYEARNQPGPARTAELLRELLAGSAIAQSHGEDDPRVQDPYSFRAAPVVLGSAWNLLRYTRDQIEHELGAVTDNPLVFENGTDADIVSAANFHGMPCALPLDTAAVALAHIAGIAERRTYHMLSAFDQHAKLPPYLSPEPGVQSGLMVTQYAAAAACNELIGLSMPASVANLSTCAGMEDYNSFGPRAAAKAARAVELVRSVVACELLTSAEGVESHRPNRSGHAVEHAIVRIREEVAELDADRSPAPDIAKIERMIASGAFTITPEDVA